MEKFRLLRDHLVDSDLSTDAELHRPEQSPAEALTLRLHRLATRLASCHTRTRAEKVWQSQA